MLYECPVFVCCYDGEDVGTTTGAATGATAGATTAGTATGATPPPLPKMFTQDEVNSFIAKERKKSETAAKEAAAKLETRLQESLQQVGLTEAKKAELQTELDAVQAKLYSTEDLHKQALAKLKGEADAKTKQIEAEAGVGAAFHQFDRRP